MKKHREASTAAGPTNAELSARSRVRYLGFEPIEGGRRLKFFVRLNASESVEIALDIADAVFTRASGLTIQDAAPMAYEKLVELIAGDAFDTSRLCLTDADAARYRTRHTSSQKRAYSTNDGTPTDVAA
jgi:hypothetical protein